MNVYDTVNRLATEIRESEEYLNFKKAKEKVSNNPNYKDKISEFEKLRYEEQINTIQSGKIPEIKEYFDTEFKFNVLIGDVNKIISESIKDVI